jgi:hypothetical protein
VLPPLAPPPVEDEDDSFPEESPESASEPGLVDAFWFGAVAPPVDFEVFAGGLVWGVPVAVGGASEYWMPLESA